MILSIFLFKTSAGYHIILTIPYLLTYLLTYLLKTLEWCILTILTIHTYIHTYYTYLYLLAILNSYSYRPICSYADSPSYGHMLICPICPYVIPNMKNAWKMHDPHISYLTTHAIFHIPNISYLMRTEIPNHIYHISYLHICSYAHSPHGHMLVCPTCPYAHISHLISHISRSHISYLISHMRHDYRGEVGGRGGSP